MPAQFTHRILAEAVLRALPASVRRTIDDLPAYFLGAQGPDIFYFLHIRRGKEKNLGAYFHGIGVYEGLCSLLAASKGSMIEKFNDYEPDWRGRRHSYIENDLDSYFVQKYRGVPVQNYPFPRIERHTDVAALHAVLNRMCRDCGRHSVSERALRAALDRFFRFSRFFADENLRRRNFFGAAERALRVPHLFSSMYRRPDFDERCLNLSHGEWRNPSSPEFLSRESADDLFARAAGECLRLLSEFSAAEAEGSPLSSENFGKSLLTGVRAGVPLVRPRAGAKSRGDPENRLLASNSRGMMSAGGDAMQRLYDSNMQLVGYLSSDAAGRMSVLDSDYRTLGYYYPQKDKTYDKNMRLVGKGNLLTSLLGNVSAEQ